MNASELRAAVYCDAVQELGKGATDADIWQRATVMIAERYVRDMAGLASDAPAVQTGLPGIEQSGRAH